MFRDPITPRPNFRNFVPVENVEKSELLFDPEKELTEEDFEKFRELIDEKFIRNAVGSGLYYALCLKILDADYVLDPKYFPTIRSRLRASREFSTSFSPFPKELASARIAASEVFDAIPVEDAFEDTLAVLEILHSNAGNTSEIETLAFAKISGVPELGVLIQKECTQERIERDLSSLHSSVRLDGYLASLKILEVPFTLEKSHWGKIRTRFKEDRERGRSRFSLSLAANMKIIAAEEVKVTDKGLEITMRKERAAPEVVPPVPAVSHLP